MAQFLLHHRVRDYEHFKAVFDAHASIRKLAGCKGGRLFRSTQDPNDVVILFEWEDNAKARTFAASQDLRQAMDRAGVAGRPEMHYLDEVEAFPA